MTEQDYIGQCRNISRANRVNNKDVSKFFSTRHFRDYIMVKVSPPSFGFHLLCPRQASKTNLDPRFTYNPSKIYVLMMGKHPWDDSS